MIQEFEQQIIRQISPEELLAEVLRMKNKGYRLVVITCVNKNGMEITYSFDLNGDFQSLRLIISSDVEVESISSIYSYAFVYENEIKELFGVNITGMLIDFKDNFYRIAKKTPFKTEKEAQS